MARLPCYLRAVPGSRGATLRIRRWHPGYWACVLRGWLRYVGVLPRLCPNCGGQGRQLKSRFLRRRRCPMCAGKGRVLAA